MKRNHVSCSASRVIYVGKWQAASRGNILMNVIINGIRALA
jgi:hypothetical protein